MVQSPWGDKSLSLDGAISGSGALTLRQGSANSANPIPKIYINAASPNYSGTVTIVTNTTNGFGVVACLGDSNAFVNATVLNNSTSTYSSFL